MILSVEGYKLVAHIVTLGYASMPRICLPTAIAI